MKVPTLFTIEEVARLTSAPRSSVFHWIYAGRLDALKVGRRRMVTEPALLRFLGITDASTASVDKPAMRR